MTKSNCSFCKEYAHIKRLEKSTVDKMNADPVFAMELKNRYRVSLVSETKRRYKGQNHKFIHAGQASYGSYPIHYCPVCGRKI